MNSDFAAELRTSNVTMYSIDHDQGWEVTLAEDAEAFYFVDEFHAPQCERGIRWIDPKFNIQWPNEPAVISDMDRKHPDFAPAYQLSAVPLEADRA